MSVEDMKWEGLEESFSELELGPDAEWNAKLSAERIRAELRSGLARDAEQAKKLNAEFAEMGTPVEMAPLYGIPPSVWADPSGIRLFTHLRLNPYDEWNRIHLPRGERGAWAINTSPHPGEIDWLEGQAIELVSIVIARLDEVKVDPDASRDDAREQLAVWREARKAQAIHVMNHTQTKLVMLSERGTEIFKDSMSKRERSPDGVPVFQDEVEFSAASGPVPMREEGAPDVAALMAHALVASLQLVAGADGKVEDKELAGFGRSVREHLNQHVEFGAVMELLGGGFSDIGEKISCSNISLVEHVERFVEAADSSLGAHVSSKARKLVYFVGHEVAESSSRGFLGRKRRISGAEERALDILAKALRLD